MIFVFALCVLKRLTHVPMKHTLVLNCIRTRLVTNIVLKRFDCVHFWRQGFRPKFNTTTQEPVVVRRLAWVGFRRG